MLKQTLYIHSHVRENFLQDLIIVNYSTRIIERKATRHTANQDAWHLFICRRHRLRRHEAQRRRRLIALPLYRWPTMPTSAQQLSLAPEQLQALLLSLPPRQAADPAQHRPTAENGGRAAYYTQTHPGREALHYLESAIQAAEPGPTTLSTLMD